MSDYNLNRFDPIIQTQSVGVYPVTKQDITEILSDMMTTDFMEKFVYTIYGNPLDSIIGVRYYPGIKADIPVTALPAYVKVGRIAFDGTIIGAGETAVISYPATKSIVEVDMGEIQFEDPFTYPTLFQDFLDLPPYARYELYLPFVGYVDIDPRDVFLGTGTTTPRKLFIRYLVDLITGSTIVRVLTNSRPRIGSSVDGNFSERILLEVPASFGKEIPLNFDTKEDIISRATTSAAGAAAVGIGMLAGPTGGMVAGAVAQGAQNLSGISGDYRRSGGFDSSTGYLTAFRPFLTMTTQNGTMDLATFTTSFGRPDDRQLKLETLTGKFVRVKKLINSPTQSMAIPSRALEEIRQQLEEGVYV